eukprot:CAMPEP_0194544880 /NCGR_PEP_ID=MMETSP0253-20130528/88299_1 /TAXON_ID=2966 /ORGANISM="Noctiluca scintillans" /LENGTH=83 /DNA_ID=CAMNT_0039391821 /DNA_START=123 /DNA_END=374 /DNA_ORIENTATION=+
MTAHATAADDQMAFQPYDGHTRDNPDDHPCCPREPPRGIWNNARQQLLSSEPEGHRKRTAISRRLDEVAKHSMTDTRGRGVLG